MKESVLSYCFIVLQMNLHQSGSSISCVMSH